MPTLKDFDKLDAVVPQIIAYEKETLGRSRQMQLEKEYNRHRKDFFDALAEEQGFEDQTETGALPLETELGEKATAAMEAYRKLLASRM